MELEQKEKKYIESVASETLEEFRVIAELAEKKLRELPVSGPEAFASVNTLTGADAVHRLEGISQKNRQSYQTLANEPAISRVKVVDEAGKERVYYFCRTTPVAGVKNLAGYRAPVGRLASLPIGEELRLPDGTLVEVVETDRLHPMSLADGWDSRDSTVRVGYTGPITIESFRALLEEANREDTSVLDDLLAEEERSANVTEGVRRSVITKMGLRDQPILDQYQDEIFRLPLDRRLFILGAPGTGKTTTLIRRLGQKLDLDYLEDGERQILNTIGMEGRDPHSASWLMFTPTELLKQYLKEAFAREDVPASDRRIRTWVDYRRDLARNTFGILRTASGGGRYVLKDSTEALAAAAIERSVEWFSDFDQWQRAKYLEDTRQAARSLADDKSPEVAAVGKRVVEIFSSATANSLDTLFLAIADEVADVERIVTERKTKTDKKIKGMLNLQVNRYRRFLDELAGFIDSLEPAQASDGDEEDDGEVDEEDMSVLPSGRIGRTGRTEAMNAYSRAVRAQARARAGKRKISAKTRNGKIVGWLGERTLSETEQEEVGGALLVQTNARHFLNPVRRYLAGIPGRYRTYRRQRQRDAKWYASDASISAEDIHPLEVDIVLLAILRGAGELLSKPTIATSIDNSFWSPLRPVFDLYRNQVVVDEATDFSPIQLACMAALAHPRLRSFFACGDFNQRLTVWGSRSADDFRWIFPDLDIKEITISYRQTRQLNELARGIVQQLGGIDEPVSLPKHVENEGVAPALLESAPDHGIVAPWLAERVCEIERFVGQLPSTAVFVNAESEVGPLAEALNEVLVDENIRVVACHQGQVMGHDNDVRVFDVQHIKGLEFEAVFFISVDRLAELQPELFGKYMYVGATRAATYLGVTCEKSLPPAISQLRVAFINDWSTT